MNVQFEPEAFRPLIQAVVAETMAALERDRATIPDRRLAFVEVEAARLLGLQPHQLRDERLRGRISASTGPKGRILYAHQDLLDYLASRRWSPTAPA